MKHVSTLENELQRLARQIEADPHNPQVYIQRGMVYFKLGSIAEAIGDFDRAEHLSPALTPYLWQRGLAYYYADRFADGARRNILRADPMDAALDILQRTGPTCDGYRSIPIILYKGGVI